MSNTKEKLVHKGTRDLRKKLLIIERIDLDFTNYLRFGLPPSIRGR